MNFAPVKISGRSCLGCEMGYSVIARKNNRMETRFRISGHWTQKAGWREGEILRLDVDAKNKLARLVPVMKRGINAKRLDLRMATKRGVVRFPWTGDMPSYFPVLQKVVLLKVIEAGTEGLIFELPQQEEKPR